MVTHQIHRSSVTHSTLTQTCFETKGKLEDVPYTLGGKRTDAERMTEQMLNVVPRRGLHQLWHPLAPLCASLAVPAETALLSLT